MNRIFSQRLLTILSLALVIPLGLLSKVYSGIANEWIKDYSGDILYEIFWCLLLSLFFPSLQAAKQIPLWVFSVTCAIEFIQLWHPPLLEWMRSYFWGKLLLGTTFSWLDFPHYLLGCAIAWLWLLQISKRQDGRVVTKRGE